ncbi:glycosyltransferase [Bradyrhizobium liaoningense]|uniref:glycosyltransferase n=1 Tax=Bradyrhizobium liaoningense TaxID=43992 RepID=UPI001BACD650|nr:glycosyltransferase [Bradyrhizobium liaoningense]MBR0904570.1 glycosyltransferase [Bradyrhizobium liaoningense]
MVASEFLGAHKNGGIGTATSHLAHFLAGNGHDVLVVYTGEGKVDFYHPWIRRLHKLGVKVTHLDVHQSPVFPGYLREATAVFDYLRHARFDLIIFQDWQGAAFSCINARNAGLAFENTRLVVIAHGPTEWLLDANRTVARDQKTLAHIHMERVAFEGADTVICPSRHMQDWIRSRGFKVNDLISMPLYLWADAQTDDNLRRTDPISHVDTLAFFGRLEERKGIGLFLKAILDDRLAYSRFKIFFVGKEATWSEDQVRKFIGDRRPWFLHRLKFEKDLDTEQAQSFLIRENCLAVIPSLIDNAPCVISECVRRAIPFLSTTRGGIPELISEVDHDRVLFEPTASVLAERFCAILGQRFMPATSAYHADEVAQTWLTWIREQESRKSCPRIAVEAATTASRVRDDADRISVILTHYERPELVSHTLRSLALQTHPRFEVILVDDGSKSASALRALEAIEQEDWPFDFRLLRCENRYLGAARNAGIEASAADRLIFMDDDNIAFPDLIEVLSRAQQNLDADIVTCQMAIFREASAEPDLSLLRSGERWCFTGGPTELGLSVNCFGDATGIYRRSVFDAIGVFHEFKGIGHEDWHLHARASLHGFKHTSLPLPLYWYRRVEGSMLHTTDGLENNRIIWDVYRKAVPQRLHRLVDLSIRNDLVT